MAKILKTKNSVPTVKEVQNAGVVPAIRELYRQVKEIEQGGGSSKLDELFRNYDSVKTNTVIDVGIERHDNWIPGEFQGVQGYWMSDSDSTPIEDPKAANITIIFGPWGQSTAGPVCVYVGENDGAYLYDITAVPKTEININSQPGVAIEKGTNRVFVWCNSSLDNASGIILEYYDNKDIARVLNNKLDKTIQYSDGDIKFVTDTTIGTPHLYIQRNVPNSATEYINISQLGIQLRSNTQITLNADDVYIKNINFKGFSPIKYHNVTYIPTNPNANYYYYVTSVVNSRSITLPNFAAADAGTHYIFRFTTGTSPDLTFISSATIKYYSNYVIEANKSYEVECFWNGKEWLISREELV